MQDLHIIQTEWRPAPFWALNDRLENDELRRQIKEFFKGGMGGFFMHARSGLLTPYLSRQFMDNIAACVDEAKKLGMNAWIYDENGWPSGTANGMVTMQGRDHQAKRLIYTVAEDDNPLGGEICRCEHEGKVLSFRMVLSQHGADVLAPGATRDFLQITHEAYKERFAENMPDVIPGSFFDEPQYANYYDENDYIPWTKSLPEQFEQMWGYDLLPLLPAIFFNMPDSRRVRTHYFKTVTEMFATSFTKQITDWCEDNGIISTGHLEWEQELYAQIRCTGSIMRHYEFETWPGTDQLGSFMDYPWINRQAASVTSQLGKGRTMVECFGVAGENFSLASRRWLYGIMLALGSDFFVPHISLYSMKQDNKRDHPPFNLQQQPWWGDNRELSDQVSRAVGAVISGKREASVLLVNPIVNAWSAYRPGDHSYVDDLQKKYEDLNYALLNANVIYDIGEENIMAGCGRIENGKLYVGQMAYEAVILLDHKNMLSSTAVLLEQFADQGGKIGVLGEKPEFEEGTATARLAALPCEVAEDAVAWVKANTNPACGVETLEGTVWSQIRDCENRHIWFVTNYIVDKPARVRIQGGSSLGRVELNTGDIYACGNEICLAGGEFAVIVEGKYPQAEERTVDGLELDLSGKWQVESKAHSSEYANSVNLDLCTLTMDGRESRMLHTSEVRKIFAGYERMHCKSCTMTFTFENRSCCHEFALATELPEAYVVQVNGHTVTADGGWFVDKAFRTYDISEWVCPHKNEITMTAVACPQTPAEDIYLIGNFGCLIENENERVLIDLPEQVEPEHLECQGFPFLAGTVKLTRTVNAEQSGTGWLRVRPADGTIVKASLNGVEQGMVWAEPWELPVEGLRPGENKLELTLVNTLRNLLGPLHCTKAEWRGAGPAEFCCGDNWTEQVNLVPFGLEEVKLVLK